MKIHAYSSNEDKKLLWVCTICIIWPAPNSSGTRFMMWSSLRWHSGNSVGVLKLIRIWPKALFSWILVHFSVCIIFLYYIFFYFEAKTLIRPFCQTQCSLPRTSDVFCSDPVRVFTDVSWFYFRKKCTVWIQIRTEHVLEELSQCDGSFERQKRMLKWWIIKYSQY